MAHPVADSAWSLLQRPLPSKAVELLSTTPTAPQYSDIANFDLNYDLSDSEIQEAKEEDTSTDFFDQAAWIYVALL